MDDSDWCNRNDWNVCLQFLFGYDVRSVVIVYEEGLCQRLALFVCVPNRRWKKDDIGWYLLRWGELYPRLLYANFDKVKSNWFIFWICLLIHLIFLSLSLSVDSLCWLMCVCHWSIPRIVAQFSLRINIFEWNKWFVQLAENGEYAVSQLVRWIIMENIFSFFFL